MFSDAANIHKHNQVKRLVLHMLEQGSLSIASMVVYDNCSSAKEIKAVLDDCKDHVHTLIHTELEELVHQLTEV